MDQRFRNEDEYAIRAARQVQAVENQAGLDGFSEPHFIGEQDAWVEAVRSLGDDGELVRDEIDACAGVAAGGGAANFGVPAQGVEAPVEVNRLVRHPGEQAFFRADEGEGIE